MTKANSFYTLKEGETLSEVAQRHGTTTGQLCKINGIQDPNKVLAGRRIALNARAVCKVTVQLLDRDRNPIPKAKIRLDYSGKRKELSSAQNGRVPAILTQTPEDSVKILIARADGSWKHITEVSSGWGNKLVTLVSPKIRLEAKTMPHPKEESGRPAPDPGAMNKKSVESPDVPKTTRAMGKLQANFGGGKGFKTEKTTDRLPTVKITNDQQKLEFLYGYTGEKITRHDYEKAAQELGCEINVIKAIDMIESGGRSGYDSKSRPLILFERHIFSKRSGHYYDKTNPDLSSKISYKPKKKGCQVSKSELETNYYSGSSDENYMRLAKAYTLDKNAALQACSWGRFQILGDNFKSCSYPSVVAFVAAQVKNEIGQLQAFIEYIKTNKMQKYLKEKNWGKIAEGYNGKNYRKFNYDKRIKRAYEKLSKAK
jgi:LysM repeat protein